MRAYPPTRESAIQGRAHRSETVLSRRLRCGLLAGFLGLLVTGCEDPADPGIPDTRISTTSTPGSVARKTIETPRDRLLYEIRRELPAIHAQPVAHLCIASGVELIDTFVHAYATRNYSLYSSLLAAVPEENANFRFRLAEPTPEGEMQWGLAEELRIHRRMFDPENPDPGESPVPPELWVQDIDIHLSLLAPFQERIDLYSQNHGADGKLDPDLWRVTDARYGTYVYWDMAGQTDFVVNGQANFVVIEDLDKQSCAPGKFLIYVWEDLGSPPTVALPPALASQVSWSEVKALYR